MSEIPSLPPGVDLSTTPAGTPPIGVVPILGGGENQETAVWLVGVVFPVLAFLFVVGRVWVTSLNLNREFGWDDYACIAGYIFGVAGTGLSISLRRYSRHGWDLPLSWLAEPSYQKRTTAELILFFLASIGAKSSLLFLYLRIFSPERRIRLIIIGGVVFVFCIYGYSIPLQLVYCVPRVGHPWNLFIGANCAHTIVNGIVQGIGNVLVDLFVFILPLPILFRLNLRKERKLALTAIFSTGSIAVIASLVGLAYKVVLFRHRNDDPSFYDFPALICVIVEINATIACSCIPSLAYLPKAWQKSSESLYLLRIQLTARRSNSDIINDQTTVSKPRPLQSSFGTRRKKSDTSESAFHAI